MGPLTCPRQGLVLEDIDASTTKEDFRKRILSHCAEPAEQPTLSTDSSSTALTDVSQVVPVPAAIERAFGPDDTSGPAPPLSTVQQAAGATAQPNSTTLQGVLAERSNRLEVDHQAQRTTEKDTEKQKKQAARERSKKMAEKQAAESGSVPAARQDWMTQQRIKQQDARADKERILKSIEQDKLARQERERQRRLAAQSASGAAGPAGVPASLVPQRSETTSGGRASATCNLQIRLFDGTSLRSRFDSSATLATSVRAYVDEQSHSDMPYNFREMRTPLPSRTIEMSEEAQSLQSLGLTPSATLVLVPVKGYTDAYASSGPSGLISRGLNTGYGLFSGALGLVGNAVGGIIGYGPDGSREGPYMGGTADEQEPSNVEGARMADRSRPSAGPSSIKIRTLADQREDDDGTELYNGNQVSRSELIWQTSHTNPDKLNFEPRKKDEDVDQQKL